MSAVVWREIDKRYLYLSDDDCAFLKDISGDSPLDDCRALYCGDEVEIVTEDTREENLDYAIEQADKEIWQIAKKYNMSEKDLKKIENIFLVLEALKERKYEYVK